MKTRKSTRLRKTTNIKIEEAIKEPSIKSKIVKSTEEKFEGKKINKIHHLAQIFNNFVNAINKHEKQKHVTSRNNKKTENNRKINGLVIRKKYRYTHKC